jgi:hypothetical protein
MGMPRLAKQSTYLSSAKKCYTFNITQEADYARHARFYGILIKMYFCTPLLHLEMFHLLNNEAFFRSVKVDMGGYGIVWNDDIDLSEYELWVNGEELPLAM